MPKLSSHLASLGTRTTRIADSARGISQAPLPTPCDISAKSAPPSEPGSSAARGIPSSRRNHTRHVLVCTRQNRYTFSRPGRRSGPIREGPPTRSFPSAQIRGNSSESENPTEERLASLTFTKRGYLRVSTSFCGVEAVEQCQSLLSGSADVERWQPPRARPRPAFCVLRSAFCGETSRATCLRHPVRAAFLAQRAAPCGR